MTAFDADAYLKRIALSAPPAPTIQGLHALLQARVLAIPFENFDILLDRGAFRVAATTRHAMTTKQEAAITVL